MKTSTREIPVTIDEHSGAVDRTVFCRLKRTHLDLETCARCCFAISVNADKIDCGAPSTAGGGEIPMLP